jgi:hypothetical protein
LRGRASPVDDDDENDEADDDADADADLMATVGFVDYDTAGRVETHSCLARRDAAAHAARERAAAAAEDADADEDGATVTVAANEAPTAEAGAALLSEGEGTRSCEGNTLSSSSRGGAVAASVSSANDAVALSSSPPPPPPLLAVIVFGETEPLGMRSFPCNVWFDFGSVFSVCEAPLILRTTATECVWRVVISLPRGTRVLPPPMLITPPQSRAARCFLFARSQRLARRRAATCAIERRGRRRRIRFCTRHLGGGSRR